jgi:hypothetical protein
LVASLIDATVDDIVVDRPTGAISGKVRNAVFLELRKKQKVRAVPRFHEKLKLQRHKQRHPLHATVTRRGYHSPS